ncbi:hypothetical protein, partial [Oceanobacter sp. 3_MG-2023]|uniref:hypothetical protein n=1 Tax=Oceanobacter sp. 3_MG-2023 TaxID=3062622 RepID=UPI002733F3AF
MKNLIGILLSFLVCDATAWADYDDRLRTLASKNSDFAGIHTDSDGTLVISLRGSVLVNKTGHINWLISHAPPVTSHRSR